MPLQVDHIVTNTRRQSSSLTAPTMVGASWLFTTRWTTASLRFVLDLVCNLFLRLQLQQSIYEISTCEASHSLSVVAELLVLCGMVCGVVELWAL